MLIQRVITALILLAVLIPALFYPSPVPFIVVSAVFICAAAWEWSRLNNVFGVWALVLAALCGFLCAMLWQQGFVLLDFNAWLVTAVAWILLTAWLLRGGISVWLHVPQVLRLLGGVVLLVIAWSAVAIGRMRGVNFLLSALALVWVADIAAYFAGRAFGGRVITRKLAPSISPGKTWEGAIGGMLGVILLACTWLWLDKTLQLDSASVYTVLWRRGAVFFLVSIVFLTVMSVSGDLVESLFKRSAGVKDSSALLPGHGGVLDRIDALLPVLPLVVMLTFL